MPRSSAAHVLQLFAGTAVFLLTASHAVAAPAPPAGEKKFSEWIKVLEPHLRAVWTDGGDPKSDEPQLFDWRRRSQFTIELDGSGDPANAFHVQGGAALHTAAKFYALHSGDFNVTLGELEQSGWWPYATIPEEMSRELVVPGEQGGIVLDKYERLKHIGSPNWISRAKREVLNDFYRDFFFRRPVKMSDPKQYAHTWSIDGSLPKPHWTTDHSAPFVPKTPADLPARHAQFWVNPYTGIPMRVSEEAGDLQFMDVSMYRDHVPMVTPEGKVNHGGGTSYIGDRKDAPKIEVAMINWKWEPPLPWAQRVGAQAELPLTWLRTGAESAEVRAHLESLLTRFEPLDEYGSTRNLQLDTSGERAPLAELACPRALALAANYYAVMTADAQVSLRDIVDAGLWPYDTFPTWLDLSETIYDTPYSEGSGLSFRNKGFTNGVPDPPTWSGHLYEKLGTPEWLLWRKAEILNEVHSELYFNTHPQYAPQHITEPRADAVLPRFAAFWTNPVASAAAGQPVPFEFGAMQGQLATVDVNLLRPLYYGAPVRYDQEVPLINLADKFQYFSGSEPRFIYRERTLSGLTEMGRSWPLPKLLGGGLGHVRWRYDKPRTIQEEVLLDIGWDEPKPLLGIDGKPQRQPRSNHRIRTYKLGDPINHGWMHVSWGIASVPSQPQVLFDGIAPLAKRYQLKFGSEPKEYFNMIQFLRMRSGMGDQLPAGRAGIDELAPPVAEPAVATR